MFPPTVKLSGQTNHIIAKVRAAVDTLQRPDGSAGGLKILHAITGTNVGGAETMLAKLIEAGTPNRFRPEVLSMMTPGFMAGRIRACDVPVHTLDMRQGIPSPSALPKLIKTIRDVRPDIIQGWMHHGNLAATFGSWALRSKPPVVWNIRHSLVDIRHEKMLTRLVLRMGARLSKTPAAIIYNSQTAARQYERFGFPSERTVIIPNGFDCDQFKPRPDARAQLCQMFGIDGRATIVGMVARLHPMKDPGNLIEGVRLAREAGHDIHLLIVGNGADRLSGKLTAAVKSLPSDRVTTVAQRNDVSTWLPGLDILALPSAWGEGFPNILGEAMACGVPCVATDIGDSKWIVAGNGKVVPPRQPEALAEALGSLVELGAEGRSRIGDSARARVIEAFSLSEIGRNYEALYDEVIGRTPDGTDPVRAQNLWAAA